MGRRTKYTWSLKGDPLGVPRNPLAIYLLTLAAVSGFLMLCGITTARGIEASLHPFIARGWGAALFFGSVATLSGAYWQGDPRTGLALKRVGYFAVMVAAFLYSMVVLFSFGFAGLFASTVVLGFGGVCLIQFRHVNKRIEQIVRQTTRDEAQ